MKEIKSHRVSFRGRDNQQLAGIFDQPRDENPIGYLLFAHCFTCSKDLKATVRLSRGLASHGWGVLRFDFTGLGNSEGDFRQTNFLTNQDDLRAAVEFLNDSGQSPLFIIGHSFGGAAAMSIGNEFPSVEGIVTLAAPSDTKHLSELLVSMDSRIVSQGEGVVTIGGRQFPITLQMIENFREYDLSRDISNLKKRLMILHSPTDATVGYHHAMRIFALASQSPTFVNERGETVQLEVSLVTLPNSDHLFVKEPRDIRLVTDLIHSWSKRFIPNATSHGSAEQAV